MAQNLPRAGETVRVRDPQIFPPALEFVSGFRTKILPSAEQDQLAWFAGRAVLSGSS